MTLRYDRLDNFWFVLFHELIHIIKHLHKGDIESIFDDLDAKAEDIEQEADVQAGEILVPEDRWNTALARYLRSKDSILDFANELGIHQAIVAGKIRREANNYMILTDMVGQGEVRKLFPDVYFFIVKENIMNFDHRHYIPCLRWKQGEYQAVSRLPDTTKRAFTPLIEVPELGWDFEKRKRKKTIDELLSDFTLKKVYEMGEFSLLC